ncbi:MAG: porin [Ectothiorhodospiraceae bacterium]|jgi:predicted porin|nr:porin [Ectothiorhodospiraceae bacterium]
MNKKVLAIAVAAALAAPAAALADTQIYGVAHVSLDFVDNGDNSSHQLSSNSSRLGFKGSEDLGNGLKAIWQIESNANLTGGSSASTGLSGRNSFVGLAGGWGTAVLGRHDTPYKMATGSLDVWGDTMGDYNAVMGTVAGSTVFDNRTNNTLAYLSPNMGGLSFALAYVTDVDVDGDRPNVADANEFDAYSANVGYKAGPLHLTAAYEKVNGLDVTAMKVGGAYSFGDTTLSAIYENIDLDVEDRNAFYVGAKHKMGATYIAASVAQAGELVADDGTLFFAVGVGHQFSKRTSMYAVWAQSNNDDAGTYAVGNAGHGKMVAPAAAGDTPRGLSFGMRHNF